MTELIEKADSGLPGKFADNFYIIPDSIEFDAWVRAGDVLQAIQKNVNWWVGDWLLFGETHFPDRYSQAVFMTGKSDTTLRNCAWVASVFPPEERRNLSFTHHFEVAGMESIEDRNYLLNKAEEEEWSCGMLRRMRYDEIDKMGPVMPEVATSSRSIPPHLQEAVNEFSNALIEYPLPSGTSEALFEVPFDWGHIELRVVRSGIE